MNLGRTIALLLTLAARWPKLSGQIRWSRVHGGNAEYRALNDELRAGNRRREAISGFDGHRSTFSIRLLFS